MPNVYIIAGSNGAGKTTFARRFLPDYAGCVDFVNADLIAEGLSPFAPVRASGQAGRLLLGRIRELGQQRRDFAFETTLSGRTHASLLGRLKGAGYRIHMFYLWIPGVELALARIRERVKHGGHDVPERVVRRRYHKSLRNLFGLYDSLVDHLEILDNSSHVPHAVFARNDNKEAVLDKILFDQIKESGEEDMKVREDRPSWSVNTDAERALRQAVDEIIEERRRTGSPLIVWRDGKVVEIDADKITTESPEVRGKRQG